MQQSKIKDFPNKWITLSVTACCLSLIYLNLSSVPVALPTIQHQLNFSAEMVEWIINAYLLTLTVLILPAGRLADLFGYRALFCWGLGLYAIGSILCGLSPNGTWLISGRVVQGMGGAAMFPQVGAYLTTTFPSGERGKAIGLNVGIGSIFLMLGPILGGWFTQYLSWRYLFWLNLPITIFGFVMTLWIVQRSNKVKEVTFDFVGASFLGISLGSVTIALMQGAKWGWDAPITLSLFLVSIVAISLFFVTYRKNAQPIVDLSFFRQRLFTAATCCGCLTQLISMVTVFWALYFQESIGFSPTSAGWIIVFANFPAIFIAPFGGHLADNWGVKVPVIMGFGLLIFALVWLSIFAATTSIVFLFPTLIAFGLGTPLIMSPSYVASLDNIQENKSASASSLSLALRQLAPTFGMAIMNAFYLSLMKFEKPTIFAFTGINLLAAGVAFVGLIVAVIFLPAKSRRQLSID